MQIEIFRSKDDLNQFLEKYRESIVVAYVDTKITTKYDPDKKQFLNFYFFIVQYEYLGQRLPESLKNDPRAINFMPAEEQKMKDNLPSMPEPKAFSDCCLTTLQTAISGQLVICRICKRQHEVL